MRPPTKKFMIKAALMARRARAAADKLEIIAASASKSPGLSGEFLTRELRKIIADLEVDSE